MKPLILLILLLPLTLLGQDIDLPFNKETGKVIYEGVVEVDSNSADQLYAKAKLWLANSFVKSKNVIDLDDPTSKTIVANGNAPVIIMGNLGKEDGGYVSFKLSLFFKDGRYKYVLTNFEHVYNGGKAGYGSGGNIENETPACGKFYLTMKNWNRIKEQTNEFAIGIVNSLQTDMTKSQATEGW